MTSVTSSVD